MKSTAHLLEQQGTAVADVPDGQEAAKPTNGRHFPTTRLTFLFWASVLLIIGACIVVFAHQLRKSKAVPALSSSSNGKETRKLKGTPIATRDGMSESDKTVCDTEDCQYTRWLLTVSPDKTKDPCDNFYAYVCGNIQQEYPWWFASKYGAAVTTMIGVQQNVTRQIVRYLSETPTPRRKQTAFQKATAYVQDCLVLGDDDENRIVLIRFLLQNGMLLTEGQTFDPLAVMFRFLFQQHLTILFDAIMLFDLRAEVYFLALVKTGFRDVKRAHIQWGAEYKRYVQRVLYASGIVREKNDSLVRSIIDAEKDMLDLNSASASQHGTLLEVQFSQLGFLTNDTSVGTQWAVLARRYTEGRLPDVSFRVPRSSLALLAGLFGNPSTIDKNSLRLFMSWTVTHIFTKITGLMEKPTVDNCWDYVRFYFPNAVVSAVLFDTVNQSRIDGIKDLMERMSSELRRSFRESDWMESSARQGAEKKVDLMHTVLAYRPGLETREGLESFLAEYGDLTGPFLANILSVDRVNRERHIKHMFTTAAGRTQDKLTITDILIVSASYNIFVNGIYASPTMLQRPAFTYGGPPEVNYGALGRTLMHEMMHGFDDDGRLYDGHGRKATLWTNETTHSYFERVRCHNETVEDAPKERGFDEYPGEYLADTMGQETLYRAYKKASEASRISLGDVGGLTTDQVFFVAGCLLWCGENLPVYGHPPLDERCNVPLMNSAHFSEAFSCLPDSPMNPRKKCRFW